MNSSGDQGVLSAPMSPNRVRKGHSQDMPAEGSLFDVSPDIPGFHMRPAGGVVQQTDITPPPPPPGGVLTYMSYMGRSRGLAPPF